MTLKTTFCLISFPDSACLFLSRDILLDIISTRRDATMRDGRDVLREGKGSNVPSWRHKVEGVLSIDLYRELSKAPSRGAKN